MLAAHRWAPPPEEWNTAVQLLRELLGANEGTVSTGPPPRSAREERDR